jgi:excisionase family DNA binding protein
MSRDGMLDAAFRELVRDVVREEIQAAIASAGQGRAANDNAEYLSGGDAARIAGVAEGTIRAWVRQGRLVPYRAGRVYRVKRGDLDMFLRGSGEQSEIVDLDARASELLTRARRKAA